jgi:hypothetical protein
VLSDHVDWPSLLAATRATEAECVLVTHGYREPVVRWLVEHGVEAKVVASQWEGDEASPAEDEENDVQPSALGPRLSADDERPSALGSRPSATEPLEASGETKRPEATAESREPRAESDPPRAESRTNYRFPMGGK